jgi:glycosyltransferase involved in cell wall biosynthesis
VRWFAEEIFPRIMERIPQARFQIVGRAPAPEVVALKERPGVEVTGGVPDVRTYLGAASLMVAPLRIARGIQNKVLEGMAARVPVIASPAAFEGIEGRHEVHALVCGDAADWASQILAILPDAPRQQALTSAARSLVEREYAWEPAMAKLEALMLRLVAARPSRARSSTPRP